METLPDAAKTRLRNTFPSSAVGLMTAQPEIHKLWLSQIPKQPRQVGGAKRQASRA
jgi:hypothetical protein